MNRPAVVSTADNNNNNNKDHNNKRQQSGAPLLLANARSFFLSLSRCLLLASFKRGRNQQRFRLGLGFEPHSLTHSKLTNTHFPSVNLSFKHSRSLSCLANNKQSKSGPDVVQGFLSRSRRFNANESERAVLAFFKIILDFGFWMLPSCHSALAQVLS